MKRSLFAIVAVFGLLISVGSASAEQCAARTNLTLGFSQPFNEMVNGWFQWLNSGTASCSGSSSSKTCTLSGATYTFNYMCSGSSCWVDAYDIHGFRNEAVGTVSSGQMSGWVWDNGANSGHATYSCVLTGDPRNPANCIWTYGTCD